MTGFANQPFAYSNELLVTGKIAQPVASSDFDYEDYLAAKGIFAEVGFPTAVFIVGSAPQSRVVAACLQLKHALFHHIEKLLPQGLAALAEAIVAGDR